MTTTHRPRLVLSIASGTVAAVLLAGCGSSPERPAPAAAVRAATDVPASAGVAIPTSPANAPESPHGPTPVAPASAPASPARVPAADIGPSLADLDRALAELDQQLDDADHDVATPEGDMR